MKNRIKTLFKPQHTVRKKSTRAVDGYDINLINYACRTFMYIGNGH